jgi:hypothetical protein
MPMQVTWLGHAYLLTPYSFYLNDLEIYLRMHLWTRQGIYLIPVERLTPQTCVIELTAQDTRDLLTRRIDLAMLVRAGRFKIRCAQADPNLVFY